MIFMSFPFKFNEVSVKRKVNLGNYESAEYGISVSPVDMASDDISINDAICYIDIRMKETIKAITENKD